MPSNQDLCDKTTMDAASSPNISSAQHPEQAVSAHTLGSPPSTSRIDEIFSSISSYPFNSDTDYLSGLSAILGHSETPLSSFEVSQNANLVLQAQCFYFARRFNVPGGIDAEAYKSWLEQKSRHRTNGATPPTPSPTPWLTTTDALETVHPHAPTPATVSAASTLSVQPHQQFPSPSSLPVAAASPSPAQPDPGPAPPYPTSFAGIVDLIVQNKPIPGIEDVPDTVLDLGSSKADKAAKRPKPWEKDTTTVEGPISQGVGEQRLSSVDAEEAKRTGEGVLKILQAGAILDSGLVAQE